MAPMVRAVRRPAVLAAVLTSILLAGCGGGSTSHDESADAKAEQDLRASVQAQGGAARYELPASDDFQAIPQDPRNPLSAAKVALGRMLFHDPSLGSAATMPSKAGTYSCASCHHAAAGFQAGMAQGIGEGGTGFRHRVVAADADPALVDVQPVRSPSAMNVAWQRNVLWNGQFGATAANAGTQSHWTVGTPKAVNHLGYEGLETQAIAGQQVHRLGLAPEVYRPWFDAAFGDWPEDRRYGAEAAGLAIAAYERTLLANQAPFQRWLRGDAGAMTAEEKRGAALFLGKAGCVQCHDGPALSSESFHALGMPDLQGLRVDTSTQAEHHGRGAFTGTVADEFCFKTPQLYNLADSPFLGHGGSFTSVRAVIEYKNRGVPANTKVGPAQLSPLLQPLGLSEAEVEALTAFVSDALRDPDLLRYQPQSLPTGACPIDADMIAIAELGCLPH